jgi:hypothetical protein
MIESFFIPSMLMGLGIAIDVAVATLARFRDASMSFRSWTVPVALAHIILPAFGYYSWWVLGQSSAVFIVPLALLAFALISVFLHETFAGWIDSTPTMSLRPILAIAMQAVPKSQQGQLLVILAVSMDALWSGPAKAAQADVGDWNWVLVAFSFFVAGAVVAIIAQASLMAAKWLNRISFSNDYSLARSMVIAKYIETSVLFGFGVLTLWNIAGDWAGEPSLISAIWIASIVMFPIWASYWTRLNVVQFNELNQNIGAAQTP